MTVWEKAVLNIQKGLQKISVVAATFAERVKAEIAIVRLRVRIDEIESQIDGLYRTVGRTIADLIQSGQLPKTTEQLLNIESIAEALNDLADRKKEREDLISDIKNEQEAVRPNANQPEDTSL